MPKYYIYKCVFDDGGAPCVDNGLYSLTICKPFIRRKADVGDWIFAFGSNIETDPAIPSNRLISIAKITRRFADGDYFDHPDHLSRGDCIYERIGNGYQWRNGGRFHINGQSIKHDLGAEPSYPRATALVSDHFRYFGSSGTDQWKLHSPLLKDLVENLGQGHRVNHLNGLREELAAMIPRVWGSFAEKKVWGSPLHTPQAGHSARCSGCATIDTDYEEHGDEEGC